MKLGWELGRPKDFKMTPYRGHEGYVNCFNQYKRNIASGSSDGIIKIWSIGKQSEVGSLTGHTGLVNCVKFNELYVASGSADNSCKIWDTTTGTCLHTLNQQSAVNSLFFDDSHVCTSSSQGIKIWDMRDGQCNFEHNNPGSFKIEPLNNNSMISVSPNKVCVIDRRLDRPAAAPLEIVTANCSFADLTDSHSLACAEVGNHLGNRKLKIYDLSTGQASFEHVHHLTSLSAFAADSTTLSYVGAGQTNINVLDIKSRQLASLAEHQGPVNSITFDEHKLVSGSQDGCIKVWNRKNNSRLYSLLGGTLQQRARNTPHPTKPGISQVMFDQSNIIASTNNMLRVYSFFYEEI